MIWTGREDDMTFQTMLQFALNVECYSCHGKSRTLQVNLNLKMDPNSRPLGGNVGSANRITISGYSSGYTSR